MALRIALARRSLCTSTVSSQFPASLAAAAAEAAKNKPAPIPSDTLFVSGKDCAFSAGRLVWSRWIVRFWVYFFFLSKSDYLEGFVFVGAGLNKRTTSEKLQEAFLQFGKVVHGEFCVRAEDYGIWIICE